MKLTKKQENSLMQVYEAYWAEYLNGNVEAMVPLLDDSYTQVGSAESEVFSTKKEAVQFLRDTIDEVAGKLEMRNRITKLEQQDGIVLVHERCDLYALTGKEWVFYSRFRATSLLQEKKTGWKITHQHSSFPDTKTEKGQNVAIDKIAQENQELRDAIKRRTAELELKNRELQIEAALERIRATAMGMQKSAELSDVLAVLFQQFDVLGIHPVNVWLSLYNKEDHTFTYRATGTSGKRIHKHQVIDLDAMDIWKESVEQWENGTADEVIVTHYPPEVLPQLLDVFHETFMAMPEKERIHPKDFPDGGYNVQGYCKFGYIGFNHKIPPTEEEKNILKKFATEFERLYQRFLDIEKAEAQAREAYIEASLERIRARAMAMHKSEELVEVATVLYNELINLQVSEFSDASIVIFDESNNQQIVWGARTESEFLEKSTMPLLGDKILQELYDNWHSGEPFFTLRVGHLALKDHNDFVFPIAYRTEKEDRVLKNMPDPTFFNCAVFSIGYIELVADQELKEESKSLLIRFAKVFDQTFTRFLDLQKAEAQAREAQIEASLERIRARAMAMHASSELNEVLSVLFEQFNILGINPVWAHLSLINLEDNTFTYRMSRADKNNKLSGQIVDLNARPEWQDSVEAFKASKPNSVSCLHFPKEVLPQIWELFNESLSSIKDEYQINMEDFPDGVFNTQGYCRFGYIGFNHDRPPTEEEKEIVVRIASEFGRVYQRFLDLQKAEAQAKEAQIEASLERIRARSMAMHSSEELNDVLRVMFEQIEVLGIDAKCAHLTLMDPENNAFSFRITGKNGAANIGEQIIDLNAMPLWKDTVSNWKKAKPHSHQCLVYPPEILTDLWKLIDSSLKTLPVKERIKISDFPNGVFDCEGHNKFGYIGFNNSRPPTDEEISIVIRFAREFERVYQRFLDIEKAEAQAREARIEAALEKVRSQSLAMHTTAEMQLVANAVYEQLRALGLEMDVVGMSGAIEAKKDYDVWVGGAPLGSALRIPYNEDTKVQRDYNKMLKDRPELFARTYSGKVKKEYIDRLLTHGEFPPALRKKMETSDAFTTLIAPKKNSGIQVVRYSNQPFTERDAEILKRFAGVFEQAYIRFMDLEKAEAQARESQIEMALEKVRSRTMAMHQSEELGEVASVMFEQISVLTNTPDRFNIGITNEEDASIDIWVTDQNGQVVNQLFVARADKSPVISAFFNARKTKKTLAMDLHGKALKEWVQYMNKEVGIPFKEEQLKEHRYINSVFFSHGFIGVTTNEPLAQETVALIGRFARVFQQTYVRFLDLQKAESQAREARIEAALERVRARSMAMHSTEEILEVVVVLFNQLQELNIDFIQAWISIWHLDQGILEMWMSPIEGFGDQPIHHERPSAQFEDSTIKTWKKGDKFSYLSLVGGETVTDFLLDMDRMLGNDYFERLQKKNNYQRLEFVDANHKYGTVSMSWHEGIPEQDKEILYRFAKVFEQTYTRFLDIQKAEAQARESQIQLSLERVRARSLAMQSSDELHDVLAVLFQQFDKLGIHPVNVFLSLFDREARTLTYRASGKSGTRIPGKQVVEVDSMEPLKAIYDKWIHDNSDDVEVIHYPKEVLPQLFSIFSETFSSMPQEDRMGPDDFPDGGYSMAGYTPFGYLGYDHQRKATGEEKDILSRFCTEFTRVYQRFLDLQRSEAQAREAQIEAALEKVRSRSLAMQKPEELQEVVTVVGEKLRELGVILDSGGVVICTYYPDSKDVMHWTATFDTTHPSVPYYLPYFDSPIWIETWASKWESEDDFFEKVFSYEDKNHFFLHAFEHSDYKKLPEEYKKELLAVENHALSFAWQPNSALMIPSHNGKLLPEEHKTILKRFARVFEQAYIRFMDLQRAEEQARESKIEMALEKVRSRTMAMHQSGELGEVASVMFEQISALTNTPDRFTIAITNEEDESFDIWVTDQNGHEVNRLFVARADESPVVLAFFKARKSKKSLAVDLHGKELKEWVQYMNKEVGIPFKDEQLKEHRYINSVFFSHGFIGISTYEPLGEEIFALIGRFATVFQQTYVRFLDLQKAEAQARESQIEVAMERVRSKAMAMHHTDELTEVLGVLFEQFDFLGINPVLTHLTLMDEENETFTLRITRGGKDSTIAEQRIDINAVESWKQSFENWKKSELNAIDCIDYSPDILPYIWELMDEVMSALPEDQKIYPSDYPDGLYTTQGHCKYGYIGFNHTRRATEEEKEIVVRFAKEFGRLYQRFLDIQKAELQAREAQIEGALERVRSKTMAMHNSEDLEDIVITLFDEVLNLGLDKSIRCGIGILEGHEGMETRSVNSTSDGSLELRVGMLNMTIHPMLGGLKKAWKNGRKGYSYEFTAKDVRKYYEALNNQNEYPFNADLEKLPEQEFHRSFFFSSGILFAFSVAPISDESSKILARFAAVFGQTYRRFLDLKKAEAQAREAQIEAALERVRAKTMAMHNTDDIADTVVTFFEELVGLGLDDTMRVGIGILSQSEEMKFWTASVPGTSETILHRGMLDMTGHPLLVGAKKAWARGDSHFTYILQGRDVRDYFKVLNDAPDFPSEFNLEKLAETVYHRSYAFGDGLLYTFTETEVPEDIFSILERFAAVFGQTYTRYLDLQKAEERAREAQIEASLERIRARAMAMQESEELTQVLTVIFEQLKVLVVETVWAHLTLIDVENNEFTYRMTGRNGERILAEQKVALDASKFWAHIVESYTSTNPDLITRFEVPPESLGDIWQLFDDIFSKLPEGEKVSTEEFPEGLYTTQAYCKFGYIGINYIRRSTDEEANILLRFANEFTRAYQRFLDLQLAEERAKDAVKQASLDRVRGQIASMRSTQDLERITPLVWNELTTLGIPFIRCGVFIMDEPSEKVQVYLSAPDGHSLGVMQLPFNADKLTAESVVHWQKGKVYKAHWNKVQFNEFMQTMVDLGQIKNKEVYQGAAQPPESLYLHFVPFTQGMLYVGSEASLFEEQIELVQSLADAFAIAYARYEDFNKLEKAKERVEDTLNALKATQNQLVQSEKMASLGELTAGIAHEIQNPLNFVNNFSEVSVELIEEMQEEVKKGDLEEAMAIMEDIKQNLDKINHHGKRADGIVKGMLQHSRASSGEKNPTDINVLADEYLRLAYHGLRAKDKSFNATLETHFDKSIGKVNIMGQDIGRVILNLITNAFYAVKERKSQQPEGFEPTVTVTTRKEENKVVVAVQDNGNGIPEAIKEKIFQPFFTTKPTGQGTGLGLSMSYDIITKGHGGELKVESKEGQGTTFTIVIPVK